MTDPAAARAFRPLQATALAVAAGVVALTGLAAIAEESSSGRTRVAVMAGLLGLIGIVSFLMVLYLRHRPVPPGVLRSYMRTIWLQLIVAALPAGAGYVAFTSSGAWWLQLLGTALCVPGLAATWPGTNDYQRRLDLWATRGPVVSKILWGSADPDEISEWMAWEPDFGAHAPGRANPGE
jgi:hypothetical protein